MAYHLEMAECWGHYLQQMGNMQQAYFGRRHVIGVAGYDHAYRLHWWMEAWVEYMAREQV